MADQVKPEMDQRANGEPAEEKRSWLGTVQNDTVHAYEAAKTEVTEAVDRLRKEIDKIDVERARLRTRAWISENPALATFIAVGAGLVAGKVLRSVLTPAPPPPLSVRARRRAEAIYLHARDYAGDLGAALAAQAAVAAKRAASSGEALAKRSEDVAGDIAARVRHLGGETADLAADWSGSVAQDAGEMAEAITHTAAKAAHDVAGALQREARKLRQRASKGMALSDMVLDAIRTFSAAFAVNKLFNWIRKSM